MMKPLKKIGICLDHATAHLLEFTAEPSASDVITSAFTHEAKEDSLRRSENVMHNKEQHQQAEYYKKLGEVILGYDEVLLFGPTEAKAELVNILRDDHRFAAIKIDVEQTDKLTENQQQAFVRAFFSK